MHDSLHVMINKISDCKSSVTLPSMDAVLAESREIANAIHIGRTLFMDKYGVSSELEYKQACIKSKKIMYHAHVGMNTWADTVTALKTICSFADCNDFVIDRAGICLDRRMSLPSDMRKTAPQESGPYLNSEAEWMEVGRTAHIQPHMGDFIIGFPASTENAVAALKAGVTTVGNLSQFFAHEAPMWKRRDITTVETARAIGIIGFLRDKGTLMHSYLDDGYGALFRDCATSAAWAYLEKYIVEDLLGAKLAHCVGGLVSDPVKRSGWIFALQEIHDNSCVGSMFYGDTISADKDPRKNVSLTSEYLMWDIMTQLECPTGHALLPVPFTEALRAPSADEICEAQLWGREVEKAARRMHPHFDFSAPREFARHITTKGKAIFGSAMVCLEECGVNTKDAVEMLYVLKSIGAGLFEEVFNPQARDTSRAASESTPNDIYVRTLEKIEVWRPFFQEVHDRGDVVGLKILMASTDVHEHGLLMISELMQNAGACVVNIGAERNPDEVVCEAVKIDAQVIFISTHNGMALEYAQNLADEMEEQGVIIPVCMGGVLNQNMEKGTVPVDVSANLEAMGIGVISDLKYMAEISVAVQKKMKHL